MTLSEQKARLRNRWVNSPATNDMPLLTFSKLMMALDVARSHAEVKALAKKWREVTAKQMA